MKGKHNHDEHEHGERRERGRGGLAVFPAEHSTQPTPKDSARWLAGVTRRSGLEAAS
jgi:hypothetical protein